MSIPDKVYLDDVDQTDRERQPVAQYVVVLTHFNGLVEVVVADTNNKRQAYTKPAYVHAAAKRFLDTGCYKSVVVAPCRTTMNHPTDKAYEHAAEANLVLSQPGQWYRKYGEWRPVAEVDPLEELYPE